MADGMNLKLNISGANKVQRELKQTGKAAGTMGKGMKGATGSAAGLGAMIGPQGLLVVGAAAVTGGFLIAAKAAETMGRAYVRLLSETLDLAAELDNIGKKAKSIGATAEDLQLVVGAMELSGVEAEIARKAMQHLNRAMGDALKDKPAAMYAEAFERLGVSARDLVNMSLPERMSAIAEGMKGLANEAERGSVAAVLFSRAGKDAVTAFAEGRPGFEGMISDMRKYGVASGEAVRNSEELMDAQLRVEKAMFGLKSRALEPMISTLTGVANGFANIIIELDDEEVRKFTVALAELTGEASILLIRLGHSAEQLAVHFQPALHSMIALANFAKGNLGAALLESGRAMDAFVEARKESAQVSERWMQREITLANALAAASVKASMAIAIPTSGPDEEGGEPDKPGKPSRKGRSAGKSAAERQREADEKALEQFRKSTMSRLEIARLAHEERVAMIQRTVEDQIEAYALEGQSYQQFMDTKRQLFDELMAHERAERAEMNRIQEEALKRQAEVGADSALDLAGAYGNAFGAMSGMVESFRNLSIQMMGEESKESKKAAKVMFGISQSLAIAQATVAMFAAIGEANKLGYPLSIPAMIAAGATGATQIAGIVATSIGAVGDAGLTPEMVNQAISAGHSTVMINRGEAVIDPVGTRAISEMLQQRASGEPVTVNTVLEIDGQVLGQTVDQHLIRSAERGLPYAERMRYGSR